MAYLAGLWKTVWQSKAQLVRSVVIRLRSKSITMSGSKTKTILMCQSCSVFFCWKGKHFLLPPHNTPVEAPSREMQQKLLWDVIIIICSNTFLEWDIEVQSSLSPTSQFCQLRKEVSDCEQLGWQTGGTTLTRWTNIMLVFSTGWISLCHLNVALLTSAHL